MDKNRPRIIVKICFSSSSTHLTCYTRIAMHCVLRLRCDPSSHRYQSKEGRRTRIHSMTCLTLDFFTFLFDVAPLVDFDLVLSCDIFLACFRVERVCHFRAKYFSHLKCWKTRSLLTRFYCKIFCVLFSLCKKEKIKFYFFLISLTRYLFHNILNLDLTLL